MSFRFWGTNIKSFIGTISTLFNQHTYTVRVNLQPIYIYPVHISVEEHVYIKSIFIPCVLSLTPSPFSIKLVYRTPGDPLPWNGVYIDRCTCRHAYIYFCWPKNALTWSILSHVKPSCYRRLYDTWCRFQCKIVINPPPPRFSLTLFYNVGNYLRSRIFSLVYIPNPHPHPTFNLLSTVIYAINQRKQYWLGNLNSLNVTIGIPKLQSKCIYIKYIFDFMLQ